MTVLERIKTLCREKKDISITTLEQTLKYSNGSLAKAKDIPSSRIRDIADFFNVSTDYLLTGEEKAPNEFSVERGTLDVKISQDLELKNALENYFKLSEKKKKLVIELINSLAE